MRQSLEETVRAGQRVRCEAESGRWERLRSENRALSSQNQTFQADNHKLRLELIHQRLENTKLTRVS